MAFSKTEQAVHDLAQPIAEEQGYRVYDVTFGKEGPHFFLRLFIDREEGVSLDDCEVISRELSQKLDDLGVIEKAYILEVSSPGVERVLKQDWHFADAVGKKVSIHLYRAVEERKKWIGVLQAADEKTVTVDGVSLCKDNIAKAHVVFDFQFD